MAGTELVAVGGRPLKDFLDWEFLTADDEFVIEARLPDGQEVAIEIERPDGEPLGVELAPAHGAPLRQPLRVLLHRGAAQRAAQAALRARRRLPALLRLRQLRDALQREGARHRAHPRVPALAALRLGARHAVGSAQGAAQQSARAEHRRAADAPGRGRHPVPRPDGDRARAQRRRRARAVAHRPLEPRRRRDVRGRGAGRAHAVLASLHGRSPWTRPRPARCSTTWSAGRAGAGGSAAIAGCSAPTSCTCSPVASSRTRSTTATSPRSRTASAP